MREAKKPKKWDSGGEKGVVGGGRGGQELDPEEDPIHISCGS